MKIQEKPKTPERIEFEKTLKEAQETLNGLNLKAQMSEEGIDTTKVSRQKFDEIRRHHDSRAKIQQKYQAIINEAQAEANTKIAAVQQIMQAELTEVAGELKRIMDDIKAEQGTTGVASGPEKPIG